MATLTKSLVRWIASVVHNAPNDIRLVYLERNNAPGRGSRDVLAFSAFGCRFATNATNEESQESNGYAAIVHGIDEVAVQPRSIDGPLDQGVEVITFVGIPRRVVLHVVQFEVFVGQRRLEKEVLDRVSVEGGEALDSGVLLQVVRIEGDRGLEIGATADREPGVVSALTFVVDRAEEVRRSRQF